MESEPALEVLSSHLCVVNLKNAYWRRTSPPEAEVAEWDRYFTSGRMGRASWKRVADKVKQINYSGPVCFSAEYSAEEAVDRLNCGGPRICKRVLRNLGIGKSG